MARHNLDITKRIPTGWKDPIGKMLTDRRIQYYQKQGFYGTGLVLREAVQAKRMKKSNKQKKRERRLAETFFF
jgi:hypothetical protein